MTDNGSAYVSTVHAIACEALGIRHVRTRPYRPPDQRQRLSASSGPSSVAGTTEPSTTTADNATLVGWLDFYNHRRPHGSFARQPPAARLNELNNPLGSYT